MDSVRKYHQLALDCLNLAAGTRDPAMQDQMLRMAERWARLVAPKRRTGRAARQRRLARGHIPSSGAFESSRRDSVTGVAGCPTARSSA
jgi:hypothetical protein